MRILIIGVDHYNTLGMVRGIGKLTNNYDVLILCSNNGINNKSVIAHSYYGRNKTFCAKSTEQDILAVLRDYGKKQTQKVAVIPCSDLVMFVLDKYHEELSCFYFLPGFKTTCGRVCYLMDKYHQTEWSKLKQIPMAQTWKIDFNNSILPDDIVFPCIIKPEISATGSKSDITICQSSVELFDAYKAYKLKGYDTAIVQKFLEKEYEVCAFGAILDSHIVGGVIKKIREYPPCGGGSLTFAQFIDDERISKIVNTVLYSLQQEGYRGCYDVEFLVCDDGIYLNEINFRHSGNGYALFANGVHAPYYWCLEVSGEKTSFGYKQSVTPNTYLINDTTHLRHVLEKRMSIFKYFYDLLRARAHSVLDLTDIQGTIAYLKNSLRGNTE